MNLESRIRKLEDWQSIVELRSKYCFYFDQRDAAAFANLFTESGRLSVTKGTFTGRNEITAYVEELATNEAKWEAHMSHNPLIDIDGDEATGKWYYEVPVVWEDGTAGWSQGAYNEQYRRVDGDWKFDRVEIESNYRADYHDG